MLVDLGGRRTFSSCYYSAYSTGIKSYFFTKLAQLGYFIIMNIFICGSHRGNDT